MARGGVNKAIVQAARLAILARGENPSIDAVRIEMGNTGSKTTIHRYLKELDDSIVREESEPMEPINDELMALVSRLAQRLKEQAQEPVDQAREQFEQQREVLEAQLGDAQKANTELHQQYEIQSLALTQESQALHDTRGILQSEQTRNAGLNQALADSELRLKDKDEQIRSLEEKHLHARDALEHYRNAVKEQREQEQRRHEGQVQQLQMELRQAQQSALVRQDEITQLHRDNERLLTENRGTLRELSVLQEQLKQSNRRQDQLLEQATRIDNERTHLQEGLRMALLDSQSLKQNLDEQMQLNKSLDTELARALTSLEESLRLATAVAAVPDAKLEPKVD
ncbi:DNA-binding protein [Pseudomonas sp. NPDC089569]|uniref:DNA-binding protein n=1 Tax=Pseudomonas sp. NPDC089569 TaxID=3390722 RepID=UPI003CFD1793